MPGPNQDLIERFYGAFDRKDGATMAACYAPDAHFWDPVFTDLSGTEAGAMWRMLTGGATDLKVELHERDADERQGSAHWIATYTFTQTGRPVVNDIHASFKFADGRITDHHDEFDFYRWARQALGARVRCWAGLRSCETPCGSRRARGWTSSWPPTRHPAPGAGGSPGAPADAPAEAGSPPPPRPDCRRLSIAWWPREPPPLPRWPRSGAGNTHATSPAGSGSQ